jgi:uncharacterized protein YcbK (DUF882 family)
MKYFKTSEFACHCMKGIACNAEPMKHSFLAKLEALREDWGKPLRPTSARRCKARNAQVGGAPFSQHLHGNACDFVFSCPSEAMHFAAVAEKFGFNGIGLGTTLVHIDDRGQRARWTYNF